MTRLIIDLSSIAKTGLYEGKDAEFGREVEHEGKKVYVNGWQHGYERFVGYMGNIMDRFNLTPKDVILVVEGKMSKARRVALDPDYKASRSSRPKEYNEQFNLLVDEIKKAFLPLGAQAAQNDGCEGDDVVAYLAEKLDGPILVMSNDADLAGLMSEKIGVIKAGVLLIDNPKGPFSPRYMAVYKALVGDTSDNIRGAPGFGDKAFLNLLVWAGEPGLAAIEGMIKRRTLHELHEDVPDFKPLQRIVDNVESVYRSYEVGLLHPEWVDTDRRPLILEVAPLIPASEVSDERLRRFAAKDSAEPPVCDWYETLHPTVAPVVKNHAVFDCELIGTDNVVFLVCVDVIETGEKMSFWWHKPGDMDLLRAALKRPDLTWISFNGNNFDAPIISAALAGRSPEVLKEIAHAIIVENEKPWGLPDRFGYERVEFDHIDLAEVAPGVKISLKAYAGRMSYPTMVDLPFHHDKDLEADELVTLESYCQNDLGVTRALFDALRSEIDLRTEMSAQYGVDLRSKSDAQVAEAILKKVVGVRGNAGVPGSVTYKVPSFIKTDSPEINDLIAKLEAARFNINQASGSPEAPEFLEAPVKLGFGTYQCGIGGLHSTHDKSVCYRVEGDELISDFDVASYYPNIMLKAGLTPRLEGGKGDIFIAEYRKIYERRMEAKRSGDKKVANSLKITLNGTFGKLGSMYSAFYSPDLMLAVTLTGQLNLMCLIVELEKVPGVKVLSANTDGIMVKHTTSTRQAVLDAVAANATMTGFEYEESPYSQVALKDVNNYVAITTDGKAKRKGLFAERSLMKNPSMSICSNMAVDYLKKGLPPSLSIKKHSDIRDFLATRGVKGGGIQFDCMTAVDDWICINDLGTKDNEWVRASWMEDGVSTKTPVKRKSRPHPVEVGVGGSPFGRIARWYMSTEPQAPICYSGSGNKVPKTQGARLCMTLPSGLPDDIDLDWYVGEAVAMLVALGVPKEEI